MNPKVLLKGCCDMVAILHAELEQIQDAMASKKQDPATSRKNFNMKKIVGLTNILHFRFGKE